MVISLIVMLCAFIGIYLYLSKRYDQNDVSNRSLTPRKISDSLKNTKLELEKKRVKKDLHKLFNKLPYNEQLKWIHELQELHDQSDSETRRPDDENVA